MRIRQVVLDFDGTCTRVEEIRDAFLRRYREIVAAEWSAAAAERWDEHQALVSGAAPEAAWMVGGAPACPAAADVYMLSGEVVSLLARRGVAAAPPADATYAWYRRAYAENPAPLRAELPSLIERLHAAGCRVAIVSNSAPDDVRARVESLRLSNAARSGLRVHGGAGKFRVQELRFEAPPPEALAARFRALPAAAPSSLSRPIYLRRGAYFEALCAVWQDAATAPEETLVAGDVWELDLAMPAALGCRVHLVARAAPLATYPYELEAAAARGEQAAVSRDLTPIAERVGLS